METTRRFPLSPLFLILLAIAGGLFLWLRITHRIPADHDGFQYFALQNHFLGERSASGEMPLWLPYMTHGTVSNWWYLVQANLLQAALLGFSLPFTLSESLSCFYLGQAIQELLLISGTWLLAKLLLRNSLNAFVIATSVCGSAIWLQQPWWNLSLYAALPLITYCCVRYWQTGRWPYLLAAGNLFALQGAGGLPYFFPVWSLLLATILACFLVSSGRLRPRFSSQTSTRNAIGGLLIAAAGTAVPLFAVHTLLYDGTEDIVQWNIGRNRDGTTKLDHFLRYGGHIGRHKWKQIALALSPFVDYSIYIGSVALPLIIAGAFGPLWRRALPITITALLFHQFSEGKLVSEAAYYYWPMMRYFRHIGLTAPLVRILLCFLMGVGFDVVYLRPKLGRRWRILCFAWALVSGIAMLAGSHHPEARSAVLGWFDALNPGPIVNPLIKDAHEVAAALWWTGALLVVHAGLIAFLCRYEHRRRLRRVILSLVVGIHVFDLARYKLKHFRALSIPVPDHLRASITGLRATPWRHQRQFAYFSSKRGQDLQRLFRLAENPGPRRFAKPDRGSLNWTLGTYLGEDLVVSPCRTDHSLAPFRNLIQALQSRSGESKDSLVKPSGNPDPWYLKFPYQDERALRVVGATSNKITLIRSNNVLRASEGRARERFLSANSQQVVIGADSLELSLSKSSQIQTDSSSVVSEIPNLTLRSFSPNEVSIDLDPYSSVISGAWLLYRDTWHPNWRCSMDGSDAVVYRADLAYKAVKLRPKTKTITFRFEAPRTQAAIVWIGLNSLIWLIILFGISLKCMFRQPGQH